MIQSDNEYRSMENQIEIYQGSDGQTQIEVKFELETVWLNHKQMAELFDKDVRAISEHIKTEIQYASFLARKEELLADT